jgi:hypothetical protein
MVSLRHDKVGAGGPEFHAYRIYPPRVDVITITVDESQ